MGRMEFRILGPLEVIAKSRVVPLDAPKQRALLALLLVRANEPVPRDLLIEELWAGRPPPSATKVLQTYVSQLRRVLGRDVIRTAPSAYELLADAGSFDLFRFDQLVANARAAGPATANGMLREALSLWRGPPLAEFAYEQWAQPEIDRLEELRLEALQERIESDLALGASAELVAELELLVGQYPLREGLRAQLMLALYRSGRQAEALAAYRDARRALVETLGIEPALPLRQLERAILDQDPALALTLRSPDTGSRSARAELEASIVVVRRTDARAARDPRAPPRRAGAAPDVDGRSRIGEDAPRARGDRRSRGRAAQARCSSSSAASGMRDSSPGRSSVSSRSRSGRDVPRARSYSSICATGKRSSSSTTSST